MQDPYTSHFQKVSLKSNEPNWRYVVKLYSGPDFFNYPTNCTIHLHLENQIFTRRAFLQNDLRTSKAFHFWFFSKISLIFLQKSAWFFAKSAWFCHFWGFMDLNIKCKRSEKPKSCFWKVHHTPTDRQRQTDLHDWFIGTQPAKVGMQI